VLDLSFGVCITKTF